MKWIHYLIGAFFIITALLQVNDPDPWLWMPIYLLVAAVAILYARGIYSKPLVIAGILVSVVGLIWLFPEFWDWIAAGSPNITSSMKASEPYIEFVREFLGFIICLAVLLFYWRRISIRSRLHI